MGRFLELVPDSAATALMWGPAEEAAMEAMLFPFAWGQAYAPLYGSMADFMRRHGADFMQRQVRPRGEGGRNGDVGRWALLDQMGLAVTGISC